MADIKVGWDQEVSHVRIVGQNLEDMFVALGRVLAPIDPSAVVSVQWEGVAARSVNWNPVGAFVPAVTVYYIKGYPAQRVQR